MDIYKAMGIRIRILRNERGITQEILAEKAGISLAFLGHIERGTRKMSIDTLYKIMEALDCSPESILGFGGSTLPIKLSELMIMAGRELAGMGK